MQNLKKWLFGLAALLALPMAHSYQCQIDLQRHYKGSHVYINNKGDAYATLDYADGRYDTMEYVYDLRSCKKISDGVKQKSNIRAVLDKNGFRQVARSGDLSPWLTHYYSLNEQRDRLVLSVDELASQEQQGLRELFAYARDKNGTLSSVAETMFNTKYAKTPQFKSAIVHRYFQSKNFERYAKRIEQELLRSPASLKNSVDIHFLSSLPFKLIGKNSEGNLFKITIEPEENISLSKIPTLVEKAECRYVSVGREYQREVTKRGFFSNTDYDQVVVDKTVTCTLNNQTSDNALKANLASSANILGLKADISFSNHELGTNTKTEVLSERKIKREISLEERARFDAEYQRERAREEAREEAGKQCRRQLSGCMKECPSRNFFGSSYENDIAEACERQCKMMYVCD